MRETHFSTRAAWLVVLSIAISGCATTPPPASEAMPVPKERLLAFQEKSERSTSTLIVTRDAGFLGSGCYYALSINNVLAARLNPTESARFFVEPGEQLLRVGRDPLGKGLCGVVQDEWTQRETILRAGETKAFRMSIDANGKTDIQRSDY